VSEKTTIKPAKNGPYLVTHCDTLKGMMDGRDYDSSGTIALCRCGGSKNKPFCDGTHAQIGFTDEKAADRVADQRDNYEGEGITVHDNRGICAHAARCTNGLPEVFRGGTEPFVDASAAPADKIQETIEQCPSSALSYSVGGTEHRDRDSLPIILVAPNGPYAVRGGADLDAQSGEGASQEHFALCRCGQSQNKPFCSGAHWNHKFDENAAS
jgi:CDGSH-type Zn-finger protein